MGTNDLDSVFDGVDNDFDTIFDQEDSLIDTVAGVKENGDPVTGDEFKDLHGEPDDNVTPDSLRKDIKSQDNSPKSAEGTEDIEIKLNGNNKITDSDIDKVLGDPDGDYQDGTDGTAPKDNEVTDAIEKELDEAFGFMEGDDFSEPTEPDDDDDIDAALGEADEVDPDTDIDAVLSDNDSGDSDISYDPSDEDIIDMAINGN